MGNQSCNGMCLGHDNQPFSLSNVVLRSGDEPDPDFAIFIDKERHQIPCEVNHVLAQMEHQKFRLPANHEPGVLLKEGYYRIRQFNVDYCGEWKNGVPHGSGEVVLEDGAVFRGTFSRGVAGGPDCLYIIKNGAYYRGQVNNNKREGTGTLKDHGYIYEGPWSNNLPEGHGKETFANEDSFEGPFVKGEKHGKGKYTWKAHRQYLNYQGEFKNNYINGKGKLKRKNGQIIEGQFGFTEHEQDQTVKVQSLESKSFRFQGRRELNAGQLLNGRPIGHFTLKYLQKGTTLKAELRNGKLNGDISNNKSSLNHKIFQGKVLLDLKALSADETRKILTTIQKSYESASKHSQALKAIKQKLKQYHCSFTTVQKMSASAKGYRQYLLVQICGRSLLVEKEKERA